MLLNITKAAEMAGIGRETLYKNYINKGRITVTRDVRNRPAIDTSEILRVFGELRDTHATHKKIQQTTLQNHDEALDLLTQLAQLKAENSQLKERLDETKEREQWQREQIEKLSDTIKLLEAPKPAPHSPTSGHWWQFWK